MAPQWAVLDCSWDLCGQSRLVFGPLGSWPGGPGRQSGPFSSGSKVQDPAVPRQCPEASEASSRFFSIYLSVYLSIDSLPRRPNHNLTDASFQVSKPLRPPFETFFDANLVPGLVLGHLGAVLGYSWTALGDLGSLLGRPGRLLRRSRGTLERSKIDPKIDPKLDSKTGRIATGKNGPNTTPVVVSELDKGQRNPEAITQKSYQNRYRYD